MKELFTMVQTTMLSGTASIIEIGKHLMKNKHKLRRSVILIAFDGEESGLYGSIHFVNNTELNIKDIKLMMSLDMVGMYQAHKGVDLTGIASLKGYEDILEKVLGDIKIKSKGKNIEMQTDTKPFGDEGIPAIHVFTGTESPYHQPEDDSHLLDYDGMAKICRLVYHFTFEAANKDTLEPTKNLIAEASGKGPLLSAGGRLNLGSSYHFYNDQFFKGKSVFAAEAGIFAQIRISEHFILQPEVLYSYGGSDFLTDKLTMHSVSFPVNLMLTAGDPDGFSPMGYFMIGGYYNYNFAGKVGNKDINFTNDFNSEEYGISYGVGMQVQHIQVGFYSKFGLTDVAKNNVFGEIFNRSSYFSVGYVF
jgi:aminopeptidase YwaD